MTPLTCSEVEARLDLHAAGEGDETERAALERHLASCPNCRRARREAEQLLALLDLQFQEPDRLARLQLRLAQEERKRSAPRVLRFSRPLASLAALLLIAVGLVGLPTGRPGGMEVADTPRMMDGSPAAMVAPGRVQKFAPEARVKATLSTGTVVRPASGSRWEIVSATEIELTAGQLKVQFDPPYKPGARPLLTVKTPAGVLATYAADFTVTVDPRPVGKATIVVRIEWGQAELRNERGRVAGSRGDILQAREQESPRRRP
jgi:predicted anti-sigma-YlaC factor YlaD